MPVGSGGEWKDDPVHEEVDERSEDHAGEDGALDQECEAAAGQVEDGGCAEGDDEMKDDSQGGGGKSSEVGLYAQHTGGNGLRDEDGLAWRVNDDRVGEVEDAGDESADEDGGDGARACGRSSLATSLYTLCHGTSLTPECVLLFNQLLHAAASVNIFHHGGHGGHRG